MLSMSVIIVNLCFSIVLTNEFAKSDSQGVPEALIWGQRGVSAFFVVELVLKLYGYGFEYFTNDDKLWNVFDLVTTLSIMLGPNFLFLRSIRLLKITKLLELPQSMTYLKELHLMLLCMVKSFFTFTWAFAFVCLVALISSLYFVAAMTELRKANPELDDSDIQEYFGDVVNGMLTFIEGAAGGNPWGKFLDVVQLSGRFNSAIFLFTIIYLRFSFLGTVTSIFVEKSKNLANSDEKVMSRELTIHRTKVQRLKSIFDSIDTNRSGRISMEELERVRHDGGIMKQLQEEGVTENDMGRFLETLASLEEAGDLKLATFVDACVKVRGSASSLDLQALKMQLQAMLVQLSEQISKVAPQKG